MSVFYFRQGASSRAEVVLLMRLIVFLTPELHGRECFMWVRTRLRFSPPPPPCEAVPMRMRGSSMGLQTRKAKRGAEKRYNPRSARGGAGASAPPRPPLAAGCVLPARRLFPANSAPSVLCSCSSSFAILTILHLSVASPPLSCFCVFLWI